MLQMDEIQKRILREVADLHEVPEGAYNIRANGVSAGRASTENIEIIPREDGQGLTIKIKPGTRNESVHIPVVMTQSGLSETVYNDFVQMKKETPEEIIGRRYEKFRNIGIYTEKI